jgi:pimeloyl-ACP methyl ester carboxylesterase
MKRALSPRSTRCGIFVLPLLLAFSANGNEPVLKNPIDAKPRANAGRAVDGELVFLNAHSRSRTSRSGTAANNSTKPLLILIPGLLASDDSMACLAKAGQKKSYPTAIFRYTSQKGIGTAATQLSGELRSLAQTSPGQRCVLVSHSMGGLVARKCIEDMTLAPNNVSHLIMIAPPNQGSEIAKLSAEKLAADFEFADKLDRQTLDLIDDSLGSFFGRAQEELCPESPLLAEMNRCERASGVRYCIIAGNKGPIPAQAAQVSTILGSLFLNEIPEARAALQSANRLFAMKEWTNGHGDGVVSVASTRLAGVDDVVTLPFAHNTFGETPCEATKLVIDEIWKRIEADQPQ